MIPKGLVYLLLIIAFFACNCREVEADEPTYCLGLKNLDLSPGERVSKFDLRITSGIVVGFPRVPLGWQIEIDNEANWMPEISGIAIEQAADLEEREFKTDFIRVAGLPKDLLKSGMPEKIMVKGYLELSHGDTKRVRAISNANITLTRARWCGRDR